MDTRRIRIFTSRAPWLAVVVVAMAACGKARTLEIAEQCPSWKEVVAPLMGERCSACHAGAAPAGGYDVRSYASAIERPSVERLVATLSDATHAAVADTLPLLSRWTGECELSYLGSRIHGFGILDPGNATDFHGVLVAQAGWRMSLCARCHGADFTGGAAEAGCVTCHEGGPTACATCHGQPPATGSHPAHAAHVVACGECHTVPVAHDDPGHPAALADRVKLLGPTGNFGGQARYDPATKTCSGVYCHGATLDDSAAQNPAPTWGAGPEAAACGACHGRPPADHDSADACSTCHPRVVAPDGTIAQTALHIDRAVDLGFDGLGGCTSCHDNRGAPLDGAHAAHLASPYVLRGPLECADCHRVPAAVDAPGHIDSSLPAEVSFGALAVADRASPAWNGAAATCSGTYCHGGGAALAGDRSPGLLRTPSWAGTSDEAACGRACHGVPPLDDAHSFEHGSCADCHAQTVNSAGNLIIVDGMSKHLNGLIDVTPDGD